MAVKTVSNTGGNWASASTWSPTGVPSTTADNVVFTTTSGPLVISATATIENIDFRNFQNTVTFNWPLVCTGAFNFGTQSYTMSFSSTLDSSGRPRGRVIHNDTSTITTNNRPWQTPWQWSGATETITLAGDITFEEDLYLSHTATFTINSGNIITKKNVIVDSTAGITTGTATFSMQPITATWSSLGGSIRNNLRLEPSNFLFLGPDVYYGGRRLTTVNSNIGQTSSTLHIESTCTLDTSNIYWNRVLCDNSATTVTLASNLYIKGKLEIANTTVVITGNPTGSVLFQNESSNLVGDLWIYPTGAAQTFTVPYNLNVRDLRVGGSFNTTVNSNKIFINRNLLFDSSATEPATIVSGTTTFEMSGTGSIASLLNYLSIGVPDFYTVVRNNIIINTTGTIYLGTLHYQTGTFQKTAGNLVNGATVSNYYGTEYQESRLIINNTAAVINVPGHQWDILQIGHRYQKPASIVRTLTEDIICERFLVGGCALVTINGTYSIYTATGFYVGDQYTSFGAAQSVVLNGTSEIYCGVKNGVGTSNVYIGTSHFRQWDNFYQGVTNTLPGTAEVNINVTVNTTGSLNISSFVVDDYMTPLGGLYTYDNIFRFNNATFSWINGSSGFQDRIFSNVPTGYGGDVLWIEEGHTTIKADSKTFSSVYISATGSTNPQGFGVYVRTTVQAQGNFYGKHLVFSPHQTYTLFTPGAYSKNDTAGIKINTSSFTNSVTRFTRIEILNPGDVETQRGGSSGEALICEHLYVSAPVYQYNTADGYWPVASTTKIQTCIVTKTFSFFSDCEYQGNIYFNSNISGGTVSYIKPNSFVYGRHTFATLFFGVDKINASILTNLNLTQSIAILGTFSQYISSFRYFGGNVIGDLNVKDYGGGVLYGTDGLLYGNTQTLTFSNYYILDSYNSRSFSIGSKIGFQNLYFDNYDYNISNGATGSFNINNLFFSQQTGTVSFQSGRFNMDINNYIGSTLSFNNSHERTTIIATYSTGTATASRYIKMNVSQNATQDLHFVDADWVDSSEGATVWSYKGNITNSRNWNQIPIQPKTVFTSFSS